MDNDSLNKKLYQYVIKSFVYDKEHKDGHWIILGHQWAEDNNEAFEKALQRFPNPPGSLYVMAEWPD